MSQANKPFKENFLLEKYIYMSIVNLIKIMIWHI